MKKWIMGAIATALILVLPAWYYLGGAKGVTILEQIQLDGKRIEKIEASFDDKYASYSSMDEIQLWVSFLDSLDITYQKEDYPTAALMPTKITIYYKNGKQDVITYGYSSLYYNEEFYLIGSEYLDHHSTEEYRDYISKNHKILDELTDFFPWL